MDRLTPGKSRSASMASADVTGAGMTGETLGDFRILRLLGQGGMGQVYLAEQISLKRKVAIKLLREDLAAHPTALTRFKKESKTIAQLTHANVVQAYMIGKHEGRHYLVLEYVEGVSLREYMSRKGPLEVPFALSIMRQVAGALHGASEVGIIHRDIKPENILLTRKGEAKVADFGLSRCLSLDEPIDLTRSGGAVGTPRYMSPEQIEGKAIDYRSDIYSFGVTCYHMLAGQPPFDGATAYEVAHKHLRGESVPLETLRPDLPAPLCALVHKMMAKKPHKRYPSARDLLKDIVRIRESLNTSSPAVTMTAETVADNPQMPVVRRKWPVVLCGLTMGLAALLAAGAAYWYSRQPEAGPVAAAPADGGTAADKSPDKPAEKVVEKPADKAADKEREVQLKKEVDWHLTKDFKSTQAGMDACMDLGVLFLKQERLAEAETHFKRMDRKPPSSLYHYMGRLGLAVTDFIKDDDPGAQAKLKDVFDSKSSFHVPMVNGYLKKHPEFEAYVTDADERGIRQSASGFSPFPNTKGPPRWTPGKYPIRKPRGSN